MINLLWGACGLSLGVVIATICMVAATIIDDRKTNTRPEEDEVDIIESAGSYECFHCGARAVHWESDFSFEDYGIDGEGIINVCSCANCGAMIEYYVSVEEDE